MSRQLNYYHRHRDEILAKLKAQRKNSVKTRNVKTNVKTSESESGYNNTPQSASSPKPRTIRQHALVLLFKLAEQLTPFDIERRLNKAGYVYGETYGKEDRGYKFAIDGLTAYLASASLTIYAEEKDAPQGILTPEALFSEALKSIKDAKRQAKKMLDLHFAGGRKILENHVAFVNDPGAVKAVENQQKLIAYDQKDGKARRQVDISTGVPESEFVHRKRARGDARLYDQMVGEITEQNAWNLLFQDRRELHLELLSIAENLNTLIEILKKKAL